MLGAGSEELYKNGNQQILYAVQVALWLLDLITVIQSIFFHNKIHKEQHGNCIALPLTFHNDISLSLLNLVTFNMQTFDTFDISSPQASTIYLSGMK